MKAPLLPLPRPLIRGDRVGLVAASSALDSGEALAAGLELLRSWGLTIEGDPQDGVVSDLLHHACVRVVAQERTVLPELVQGPIQIAIQLVLLLLSCTT